MAKLGLIFIAVFCIVQLSLAARIPRESGVENTTSFLDTIKGDLGKLSEQLEKGFKETFTKENADKFLEKVQEGAKTVGSQISEGANSLKSQLSELAVGAQKQLADLTKEEKKN